MKLFSSWVLAGIALGQEEYSDYPDYAYEYNGANGARPPTTSSGGTTTQPTTADYTTTEAATTEASNMADDFVQPVAAEAPEEAEEPAEPAEGDAAGLGRMNMDQFWFPVGKDEGGGAETPAVYVPPISRLDGELLADGDIQLSWDLNSAAHDS